MGCKLNAPGALPISRCSLAETPAALQDFSHGKLGKLVIDID